MTIQELRRKLRTSCKPTVEELCTDAGLSAVEAQIIILSSLESVPVEVSAQNLNMSVSTYTRTKRRALLKLCDYIDHFMTGKRA